MAVDEHPSDDKPVRAGSAAGLASPCPDRNDPGAEAEDKVHSGGKEQQVISESSEDENDEGIEGPSQGQGIGPDALDPEKAEGGSRPPSRRASSFANAGIVPRAQRRGLLGRLTVIPEIERPYEYKNSTKWMITAIVALAGAGGPMGSGIFLRECRPLGLPKTESLTHWPAALPSMSVGLGVSETITNFTISFYMLAMSIFPLWWHVPLFLPSSALSNR
jgi:hypothetical protein